MIMKKATQRVGSAVLALVASLQLTACGGNIDLKVDPSSSTKTVINVGNYYGGLKDYWLTEMEKQFEAAYSDYVNGDKVGVDVVIDNNKSKYSGETLLTGIKASNNDVFFTEKVNLPDYISNGLIVNINDVVTEYDLHDYDSSESVGTTIESKLTMGEKDYLKGGDGNYYALPFYEGYYTLMYDVALFEENGYYFASDYKQQQNLADKFTDDLDNLSDGPDGESGTYDDGLPATYADFYDLLKYMSDTPITYPGAYMHYWLRFMFNLWADYEGAEQMALNFSLDGTAKTLIDVDQGTITPIGNTTITDSNAAILQKQAGKYYALEFVKGLAGLNCFSSNAGGNTHTDAQNEFVWTKYQKSKGVAILLDGNWFESEATGAFQTAAISYGAEASKANSRIAIMPLPKATEEKVGTKSTYLGTNNSFCFINKNCKESKMDIVKKFVAFCHTNNALVKFTEKTGMARPFEYTIADPSSLTEFARSTYNIHQNSDVVYPYSTNSYVNDHSTVFAMDNWSFTSIINSTPYENPFTAFINAGAPSVENYFKGLYTKQNNALKK